MGTKETVAPSTSSENTGIGLKDIFKMLADDTGRVTSARLKKIVADLELDFDDEEIKEMISVVDPAGKGEITYNGLVGIVRDFNNEFPQVQLTPEEMKRELTVLLEENTTLTEETITEETNQENDEEQTKEEEEIPENTKPGHVVDLKQICEEEKVSDVVENDEEETDAVQEEEGTDQEQEEADEEGENDTDEDEADNESEGDANDENDDTQSEAVSKPPSRMTTVKIHRLDSEISTAVGKMVADDNKSMKSTTSRRTMRSRSKSEGSILTRRGSLKSNSNQSRRTSSRERSNSRTRSRTGNQQVRKLSQSKPVFKAIREPGYYSTIGCSLKLSQIRVKQRLLYIMWRVVYEQAMKKMQEEKRRQMVARRQGKKIVKKRIKSM